VSNRLDPGLRLATACAVVVALALHYFWLAPWMANGDQDYDALHLYYPLAARLLAQGPAFFLNPASIEAPPFSFIYPALIGVPVNDLRIVNAALSGVTLLLVFRTAWLLHSQLAGVLAAFLFALSPTLRQYLATPITEPPYLLLCAAWLWGLAEWVNGGKRRHIAASAIALVLAVLTRAILFNWAIVLMAAFAWWTWRSRGEAQRSARFALAAYELVLIVPMLFIAKNAILFDFPFFVTGAGNALYLGHDPVTGGYDPGYVGIPFDVGAIARNQLQLTLEAEHLLGRAGRMLIAETPPLDLLAMYARKTLAFIFVTSAEPMGLLYRCWRIGLVIFALPGLCAIRHPWLRTVLAGMLLYQVAMHVPVLYTHRYSVGGLDLWLVIAAGIGVASVLQPLRWRRALVLAVAAVLGIGAGAGLYYYIPRPQAEYFRAARLPIWDGKPFAHVFRPGDDAIEFRVEPSTYYYPWNFHVLWLVATLERDRDAAACDALDVSYRSDSDRDFQPAGTIALGHDAAPHGYGLRPIPLKEKEAGVLRLSLACPGKVRMNASTIRIFSPVGSHDVRQRLLGEKSLFLRPLER
jgi:hypothetical protein